MLHRLLHLQSELFDRCPLLYHTVVSVLNCSITVISQEEFFP